MMDDASLAGAIQRTEYACRVCGSEWSYGVTRLPDPDQLRQEAEQLEQLATDVEESRLAARIREGLA